MTDCKHDWHFLPNTDRLQCRRCKAETGPRETEGAEPVQAPWTEDLVRDALTWGTAWNMGGKRIDPMSVYAVPTEQLQGYKLHDSRPNTIRFYSPGDTSTEVLRISKDGIWANPDIPTDEAAKKVLEALDSNIKGMIERLRDDDTGVSWGVDWGRAGEKSCATIIKRLPNGKIKVMAVEYQP
jgi:hypothetical protein